MSKRILAIAALAVVLAVGGIAVLVSAKRVTVTCALVVRQPCVDTADMLDSYPGMLFYPPLTGGLLAMDVRPAPSEWSTSVDAGFRDAEWAAWIVVEGSEPILAPCYYSSDWMVSCDLRQPSG